MYQDFMEEEDDWEKEQEVLSLRFFYMCSCSLFSLGSWWWWLLITVVVVAHIAVILHVYPLVTG